jgi:hypothetical protein
LSTSYSETSSYLDCKRRHHYSYIEQLERITESAALSDGKIGHTILEKYYTARMQGLDHEMAEKLARHAYEQSGYTFDPTGKRADLEQMIFDYYLPNEPYLSNGFEVLAVEKEFVLRWDDADEGYKFIVDLILRSPTGQIVIVDHKFTGRFTQPDMLQLLPQVPLYIGAIRAMGMPADYGEYNEINMTKVAKKRTVPEAMKRSSIMPTNARIVETFRQQVEVAREIETRKTLTVAEASSTAWRSIDKIKCGMCSFQSICIGELAGSNTELIRRTDYKKREKKVFVEEIA